MTFKLSDKNEFKIMIIADIQECKPLTVEYSECIKKLLLLHRPQLVVLLGDMIFGPLLFTKQRVKAIIESICKPINEAGVPFTFVWGNHDADSLVSMEYQAGIYKQSEICALPNYCERDSKDGYVIDILDSGKENKIAELAFIDSGATGIGKYGITSKALSKETLNWLRNALKEAEKTPVYLFQHVPIYEIYKLLRESADTEAVRCHGPFNGMKMALNREVADGILGEAPCPSWQDAGEEFDIIRNSENVKAMIFGHDHKNAFEGNLAGVAVLQTPCAGLNCYGNDDTRGIRLLTINKEGDFTTEIIFFEN